MISNDALIYIGLGLIVGGWFLLMTMLALNGYWVTLAIGLILSGIIFVRIGD